MKTFYIGGTIALLIIGLVIGAFFYGKYSTGEVTKTTTVNESVVRKIAEMATVESKGLNNYTYSTKVEEKGIFDLLKNFVAERTITVNVPYTAKYECKLDSTDFEITSTEELITVTLPEPKLLSYELNLKGMMVHEENGVAVFEGNNTLVKIQGEAYESGKQVASSDTEKITLAKNSIREAMIAMLGLTGKKVMVVFPSDKIIPLRN